VRIRVAALVLAGVVNCYGAEDQLPTAPVATPEADASQDAKTDAPTGGDAAAATDAAQDAPKPIDASAPDTFSPPTYSGEATYYPADGRGACGFSQTSDPYLAAMNQAQYKKALCGSCAHVVGPQGDVIVKITDLCPGCSYGDLDLSEQAFAAIAKLSAGRVKIAWSFVQCP
jgi:expansin (peptidoglycan-binding protein)